MSTAQEEEGKEKGLNWIKCATSITWAEVIIIPLIVKTETDHQRFLRASR